MYLLFMYGDEKRGSADLVKCRPDWDAIMQYIPTHKEEWTTGEVVSLDLVDCTTKVALEFTKALLYDRG